MLKWILTLAIAGLVGSATAAEPAPCSKVRALAEVVSIEDLSSTVHLPVVSASGHYEGLKAFRAEKYRVTLRGADETDFTIILNARPASKFLSVELSVCPAKVEASTTNH